MSIVSIELRTHMRPYEVTPTVPLIDAQQSINTGLRSPNIYLNFYIGALVRVHVTVTQAFALNSFDRSWASECTRMHNIRVTHTQGLNASESLSFDFG